MGCKEDLNLNTVGKSTDNVTKSTIKYKNFHSILNDPDIAECFLTLPIEECYLNLPNDGAVDSPLDMQTISEKQTKRRYGASSSYEQTQRFVFRKEIGRS